MVRRRPVAGLRGGEVGARPAHAGGERRRAGSSLRCRRDFAHARPPAHLALRRAGRHPLDARADRAASATRDVVLLPPERPRREDVRACAASDPACAEGWHAPDARRARRGPEESGYRCTGRAPGTAGDARGNGRHHLAAARGEGSSSPTRWTSAFRRRHLSRDEALAALCATSRATARHGARLRLVVRSHREGRPVRHEMAGKALAQETADGLTHRSSPNERDACAFPRPSSTCCRTTTSA